MKHFIREATANLRAICTAKTPNCLPQEMRQIIRQAVEEWVRAQTPEVIFVQSSSMEPCDVIVPPSCPESVASVWTHVTHKTNDTGFMREFHQQFLELCIQDFIESINDALRAPVLMELRVPTQGPVWIDEDGSLEHIKSELMTELGHDISELQTGYAHFYLGAPLQLHKDNDFPATVEGFNLSTSLVLTALDCGIEDNRGDLEQAGVTPSSWFRLASAVLGALSRGALHSGGRKIQGRVCIGDDDPDERHVADGLALPVTQGGRIAAQAQQIANFFIHYAGTEEPPLTEFYDSMVRLGQNHLKKVVRLKVAATYQITTSDVQGLTDLVLNDMSKQLYTHMTTDPEARHSANKCSLDRLFIEAQQQLGPFMEEWKMLYKHSLVQALKDNDKDREESPPVMDPLLQENVGYIKLFAFNRAKEIRESIARTVTDPILDGDEVTRACKQICLDHVEEIEAARQEVRAQISSEKKAWAVAFRNSSKLSWLTKVAEEMGFVLISKDDTKEREGRMTKCHSGPSGKCDHSGS
ncbi:hypothetical protein BJY52DRAFT_1200718 [Lactarius psammicola]|nr:hypothetical protein BJY52DRAFT_1200718 [Lactarius psammicola]